MKLIDCPCKNMDFDRRSTTCTLCNNSLKTVDPTTKICNMCGENMAPHYPKNLIKDASSLFSGLEASAGSCTSSNYLLRNFDYLFQICECCLFKMFQSFKIPPTFIESNEIDYDDTLYHEQFHNSSPDLLAWKNHLFNIRTQLWYDKGGMELKYKAGICNATLSCANKAKFSYQNDETEELTYNCSCDLEDCMMEFEYTHLQVPFIKEELRVFV